MTAPVDAAVRASAGRRPAAYLARVLLLALVYFAAAKGGLALAYANSSVTAVWAPTGIALAALVLRGYGLWPGVALGALLANADTGVPAGTVLGITAGNTLEALAGSYLLVAVAGFRPSLDRIRDVLALVGLAGVLGTMVSATIGVASLQLGGAVATEALWSTWRTWWLGDMGGVLLVAPFVFALARPHALTGRSAETAALVTAVAAVGCLAFSGGGPLAYLTFPTLIWAALRFGQAGAAVASLLVATIAIAFTANDQGPFVMPSLDSSLLFTQTFVAVAAIAALLLAAAMSERAQAERQLRNAADRLDAQVAEQTAALRRALAQVELQGEIACNMAEGVILVRTSDVRIVYTNRAFETMFGYQPGELDGLPVEVVNAPDDRDPAEVAEAIQAALARHGVWSGEVQNVRKDGSTFWCHANVSNFDHHELGELSVAVHTDVTDRKRMREDLERSNAELQQFAYLASHDLHEPLRVVSQLVLQLQHRYGADLDDQAHQLIDLSVDGVHRMQRMIDALLEFARLGNTWAPTDAVDCQRVVRDVTSGLRQLIEDRHAELHVGPLPIVPGEPTLIGQLLQNLIANAIHYGHADRPVVTVTADHVGCDWHFRVTDNGDGIPTDQRDNVFQLFKRLHGRNRAGAGIGLAICRRIVEAHRGRIWIDDASGGGTTFVFTLPDSTSDATTESAMFGNIDSRAPNSVTTL